VNFYRKLSAVFRCHDSFDVLQDARHHASVIVELLGAVRDLDAGLFTDKFVMRALISVLKASPSANVVDQDLVVIGLALPDVGKQLD
jgi:hypothetical protein